MVDKIVLGLVISIVLFNVLFFYFKWRNFNKKFKSLKIPPWIPKCPDYWKVGKTGECININRLGKCFTGNSISDQTMNFNQPEFKGNKGMYNKCIWALPQNCNTPWEGIDSLCV